MFLGVNKYAPVAGIEGDMGWIPPETRHKLEILRTWNNLVAMDNTRLPKLVYNYLREQSTLWAKDTKEIFNQIKCLDLFDNNVPIINFKEFLNHAKKPCCLTMKFHGICLQLRKQNYAYIMNIKMIITLKNIVKSI